MHEGIVLRATNGGYTVDCGGRLYHCTLRGNLKKRFEFNTSESVARRVTRVRRARVNDPIAVGDRVRFAETHHGAGAIEEILPRISQFTRSGFRGIEQTVVANLDRLMVVFACAEPNPDLWLLDRFLVAAGLAGVEAFVVANKVDLLTDATPREIFAEYLAAGYRVIPVSAHRGDGVEELRAELAGHVSAYIGPSGAGKSSLLNALQPGLNLRTTAIGYVTYKGRHTTTSAQLIPIHSGGWVVDTPGLRQLNPTAAERQAVAECFPEFEEFLAGCRFDDCRHDTEPGCRLKEAVASGRVSERRYRSFLALAAELDAALPRTRPRGAR